MSDQLLTVYEIAELLKVNPQTVRNRIDRGELSAVRVGSRRVRVRTSDLDTFIAAGTTRPPSDGPAPVAEEPAAELWARLGVALADASRTMADEEREGLIGALQELAAAARELAATVDTGLNRRSGNASADNPNTREGEEMGDNSSVAALG
jgi:excisionase family DNA binding protein